MLRRLLRPVARRLRGYMQADVMAELALLRAECVRREDLAELSRGIEAALLTLALQTGDRHTAE